MTDLVPAGGTVATSDAAVELLVALERAGAATPVALDLGSEALPWERYVGVLALLGSVKRRTSWYLGDALNYGEKHYGEDVAQAAEAVGLNPHTLVNYRWVASRIPPSRRVAELSFGAHDAVAALDGNEQRRWLAAAREGGWSRETLRKQLREAGTVESSRPALGEAQEAAEERIAAAVQLAKVKGRRLAGGWWIPAAVWAELQAAA